ncbi:MAG: hypothetical protein Q9195_006437 [Heterodermia aff. obscurata]
MQLSMRDVVVAAIMAGMDCTDVSFQSQALSMQGDAGTITSSRHPVLGALIHFAPKQPYDDHGLRVNNGAVSPDWLARMIDIVTVAGCRYDARDRKHFEEDESSWVKSSKVPTIKSSEGQNLLPASSALRRRRRNDESSDKIELVQTHRDSHLGEQSIVPIASFKATPSTTLHRPHDGIWAFAAEVQDSVPKPVGDECEKASARLPQRSWCHSLLTSLHHILRKVNLHSSSARSKDVLPVVEPKALPSRQLLPQPEATEFIQGPQNETVTTLFNKDKVQPEQLAGTHPRTESLATYIPGERQVEIDMQDKDTAQDPGANKLYLLGKSERDRSQENFVDENHAQRSLDDDRDRTEYVVNKWQKIFNQRRKNRSRGRSHSRQLVLSQRRTPHGSSTVRSSLGNVASKEARTQNERRQFRLKLDRRNSSVDSDESAHEVRESRSERIRSVEVTNSGPGLQELGEENQSQISGQPSTQYGSSHKKSRRQIYSRATDEGYNTKPEISEDDAENVSAVSRRGRRRNSSLAREGDKIKVLEYGSSPVRSSPLRSGPVEGDRAQPRPDDSKQPIDLVSPRKPLGRRVRMVSPSPQKGTDTELVPRTDARHRAHEPKGILRRPTERFPEQTESYREGVAPLGSVHKASSIPSNARWTKIDRRLVSPQALDFGNERYEERQDYVIVLRVLTKEEIELYALKTQELRGLRDAEPLPSSAQSAESDEEEVASDGSEDSHGSWVRRPKENSDQSLSSNDADDEAIDSPQEVLDPPKRTSESTKSNFPRPYEDGGLTHRNEMPVNHHDQARRLNSLPNLDTKPATAASFEAEEHQPTKESHRLSFDPNEQSLSYEEELLFLRSESVLKLSRESTKQCKDIIVTLRFFANDQPSVGAEVNVVRDCVQASNSAIKQCLMVIEPLRDQKKLAAFINSEIDILIRGFRVSLNALNDRFGLFDITPMSLLARLKAWDNLCSSFEEQYSCSIVEHLSLCCRFGEELRANLEAGILSSPESSLLKSRVLQVSKFTTPGITPTSPASPSNPSISQSRGAFRFVRSPSRFTQSPIGSMSDEGITEQRSKTQSTRNTRAVKVMAPKAQQSSIGEHAEESDSLETDESSSPSEQLSTDSTLADSGPSPSGEISWFWICQADVIPGFLATPWKILFSEATCIGAISVLLNVLENFTNGVNCRYVGNQDRCRSWIDTGKSSFPGYAHNANGGVVVSGIYEEVKFACLDRRVPPIELLGSYNYQVGRNYTFLVKEFQVEESLGEIVGLDSWLSICSRLPEISDGSSDLLRVLPSLVRRTMADFDLEFSNLDRTSRDGGLRIIQTIADSLLQSFRDQKLSAAEQLFASVAIMRTVKLGLCIARGTDTLQLRDILVHDVQVYMA